MSSKTRTRSKRPALVLDIDETSLTNWPNLLADDFGFVADGSCDVLPAGPCGFNQWILKSSAEGNSAGAEAVQGGKGQRRRGDFHHRPSGQVSGIQPSSISIMRDLTAGPSLERDPTGTISRRCRSTRWRNRIKVEAEGYTIIANVGDQMSDIDGEHGGCTFKVPNPFYFIP